jgi:DNA-binding HxlR family transcriptional regulator
VPVQQNYAPIGLLKPVVSIQKPVSSVKPAFLPVILSVILRFSYMYMKKKAILNNNIVCQKRMQAIRDTMEILSGKWKFHILGTLMQSNSLRFMDLLREVDGIGAKMLSKELQDMEINRLVTRRVLDTKPVTVEYEITEHGRTLAPIIDEIAKWGIDYREVLYKKKPRT